MSQKGTSIARHKPQRAPRPSWSFEPVLNESFLDPCSLSEANILQCKRKRGTRRRSTPRIPTERSGNVLNFKILPASKGSGNDVGESNDFTKLSEAKFTHGRKQSISNRESEQPRRSMKRRPQEMRTVDRHSGQAVVGSELISGSGEHPVPPPVGQDVVAHAWLMNADKQVSLPIVETLIGLSQPLCNDNSSTSSSLGDFPDKSHSVPGALGAGEVVNAKAQGDFDSCRFPSLSKIFPPMERPQEERDCRPQMDLGKNGNIHRGSYISGGMLIESEFAVGRCDAGASYVSTDNKHPSSQCSLENAEKIDMAPNLPICSEVLAQLWDAQPAVCRPSSCADREPPRGHQDTALKPKFSVSGMANS
ncbi:MAG: hypothetical protein M1818_003245 [Claussenomyces sp. TS43310]|nr:MAG: hypothetical protein M1818_003245 [Claussenomyces sp. TS43310]